MISKVLWRLLGGAVLLGAVVRCGVLGKSSDSNTNGGSTGSHHTTMTPGAQDAGNDSGSNTASGSVSQVSARIASSSPRPEATVMCPTGTVACNNPTTCTAAGGPTACHDEIYCCPNDGQCQADGTCLVAPVQCDACANGGFGGLCCNDRCCPEGSTCDGTFCHIQATIAPKACVTGVSIPCNGGCCPKGTTCDTDRCVVRGGTARTCDTTQVTCDDGTCCPTDGICCGGGCCAAGSTCSAQGTCVQAADPADPKTDAVCPAHMAAHTYTQNQDYVTCCPTGLTTPADSGTCLTPADAAATCPNGEVLVSSGYCCPDLSNFNPSWNAYYSLDINNNCVWYNNSAPTCENGQASSSGLCCPDGLGTTRPSDATEVCCQGGNACGDSCCVDFFGCTASDPDFGDNPSCALSKDSAITPACPTDAPNQCGNVCCAADTACGGTFQDFCGCPLNAPYWCGDSCAVNAAACSSNSCPADHPTRCGDVCCVGDCITDGQCSCGSGAAPCSVDQTNTSNNGASFVDPTAAADFCCDSTDTCTTVNGSLMCARCPSGTPMVCGENCCEAGDACVDGQCVHCKTDETLCNTVCCSSMQICIGGTCECSGSTPITCGDTCCKTSQTCKNGSCRDPAPSCPFENDGVCDVPQDCPTGTDLADCSSGSGGSGGSGSSGGICPQTNGCTCASGGDCCNVAADCPGTLNVCGCPTQ
ncbi:MAG TPA: hypothetical protein VL137_16260 [Polyangiaceae bacterium]|nr:hypothetical protein [Polyangiaceae bacterium]